MFTFFVYFVILFSRNKKKKKRKKPWYSVAQIRKAIKKLKLGGITVEHFMFEGAWYPRKEKIEERNIGPESLSGIRSSFCLSKLGKVSNIFDSIKEEWIYGQSKENTIETISCIAGHNYNGVLLQSHSNWCLPLKTLLTVHSWF